MKKINSLLFLLKCVKLINGQPPTIASFSPLRANPGEVITITGTNFNTITANNFVLFGATKANVTSATATNLSVIVPFGATYAPITLLNTNTGLATNSKINFTSTYNPTKSSITTSDFSLKQNFETGNGPHSVAIGE